jgi:Cdc6-like AAA superfamily ATPase
MLGREEELKKICGLLRSPALFPAILLVGPPKSGKTQLMSQVSESLEIGSTAQVSCLSATIRIADIFEDILKQIGVEESCSNLADFVAKLNKSTHQKIILVLKHADRLRSLDPSLLPSLIKLNELVKIKVSVVLISRLPWSRWRVSHHLPASPPVQVFLKTYTRSQLNLILKSSLSSLDEPQVLKDNFVDVILSVFQPVCKSWPQFKRAADLLWPEYIKPTKDSPGVEPDNAR